MRNFQYAGLLQTYQFGSSGQSEAHINIYEVKNNRPVVLASSKAS